MELADRSNARSTETVVTALVGSSALGLHMVVIKRLFRTIHQVVTCCYDSRTPLHVLGRYNMQNSWKIQQIEPKDSR